MKARHVRKIRSGIGLARLWLDPVLGNTWYIRAAYAGGGLVQRAFDEYVNREWKRQDRRRAELFRRNGISE